MTNTCPRCHRHFRVPEGESGEHDCPHCGLTPEQAHYDPDTDPTSTNTKEGEEESEEEE